MSAESPEKLNPSPLEELERSVKVGLILPDVLDQLEAESNVIDVAEYHMSHGADALMPDRAILDLTVVNVSEVLDERGYFREMPKFQTQVVDTTRTMPFRYKKYDKSYGLITEHDALTNFSDSLNEFLEQTATPKGIGYFTTENVRNLREDAISIRENMNFIGHPEYQEAVAGIAERWKAYLEANTDNMLCLHPGVSSLPRYQHQYEGNSRKSDKWLMEDVLLAFSPEEYEKYADRIVSPDYPGLDPAHTRIVLTEDWSISGQQMKYAFEALAANPAMRPFIEANCIEINLLIASAGQLIKGFPVEYKSEMINLPIVSYFLAHDTNIEDAPENHAHISGAHSAVNYGFRDMILDMMKINRIATSRGKKAEKTFIPLLHIEGMYKDQRIKPVFTFEQGRLVRHSYNGNTANEKVDGVRT